MSPVLSINDQVVDNPYDSSRRERVEDEDLVEPVAIVGFSLKFPQDATSPETFWNLIAEKRCAMTEFPPDRLNINAFYHPDDTRRNTLPVRGGHFIKEDLGVFDANFFSITPSAAAAMDPAQRILLETAFRAFENAGISLDTLKGSKTAVLTGCFSNDYLLQLLKDPEQLPIYAATGASLSMLANRLSWFFDLSGPSVNLDSACSSSAMAIDQACQILHSKDSDIALVAGCNLTYVPEYTNILTNMHFLSPDDRCFTFDHRANGYSRGEGVGVVVLKLLSKAIRDHDTIRAVIRSTGSNQDARTPGITQPNGKAQTRLMRETYYKAGLTMKHTRFFEAHGTGTSIGDPTEISAIADTFRSYRSISDPLFVGAVKTNVGHLEGASGMTGLIKTILVLEKGLILPNTNFERVNPKINTERSRISFPLKCIPWPTTGIRRASINSFGFGGANCHLVLDDAFSYLSQRNLPGNVRTAPEMPQGEPNASSFRIPHIQTIMRVEPENKSNPFKTPKLLIWSASDEASLEELVMQYQKHCSMISDDDMKHGDFIPNLAYTLDSRRSSLHCKAYAVVSSVADAKDFTSTILKPRTHRILSPRLGFIFTGQGAQWCAMGRELLNYKVFESAIEESGAFLASLGCSWSVKDELLKTESESHINQPELSQSLCAILQIGLVDLLKSFGVLPVSVVGHSSGEIAAAYCAGALSRQSALKIAYYRGMLSECIAKNSTTRGAMMSVGLSVQSISPYFDNIRSRYPVFDLVVSCVNSPKNITISGEENQIKTLKELLDGDAVFARRLAVSVAYHSPQMKQIAAVYRALIGSFDVYNAFSSVRMISSVTGSRVSNEEVCQASYWVKNLVSPVLFLQAIQCLCSQSRKAMKKKLDRSHQNTVVVDCLVEIGPHAALQRPIREIVSSLSSRRDIGYSSALYRNVSGSKTLLRLVGYLHSIGVPVDLRRVNDPDPYGSAPRVVLADLPEYPFNHTQRYWHESRLSTNYRLRSHVAVELLGSPALDWNPLSPQWRNCVRMSEMPWLEDHNVNGRTVYPAAAMIVMAIEAVRQMAVGKDNITGYTLSQVRFHAALEVSSDSIDTETRFCLQRIQSTSSQGTLIYEFTIFSLAHGDWIENCNGTIQIHYDKPGEREEISNKLSYYKQLWDLRSRQCTNDVDLQYMYSFLREHGLCYGPSFQGIKAARYSGDNEAVASVNLFQRPEHSPEPHVLVIHPSSLDSIIQLTLIALCNGGQQDLSTQVVTAIQKMWIANEGLRSAEKEVDISTKINMKSPRNTTSSYFALDRDSNNILAVIEDLEISAVASVITATDSLPGAEQTWYNINTMVDVDMLTPSMTVEWLERTCGPDIRGPKSFHQDVNRFLFWVLRGLKYEIQSTGLVPRKTHLEKYVSWMNWQLEKHAAAEWNTSSHTRDEALISRIKEQGSVGEFFLEVGNHILGVFKGDVDILQLLFESTLVKDYYKEQSFGTTCFRKLEKYLDGLSHKHPDMQILEIGAGTGAFTEHILHALSVHDGERCPAPRYNQYFFTDISTSFFDKARELYSDHGYKMVFKSLDIERNPVEQGYEEGSFDLITASNVLHVTKNLDLTIQAMRKLLKPGGKLIFHEITSPEDIKMGSAFGLLPGWWLGTEDNRRMSPVVTESAWNDILTRNGFSGADIVLPDYADDFCHQTSIIISTAISDREIMQSHPNAMIVIEHGSPSQSTLASQLRACMLEANYSSVHVVPLSETRATQTDADLLVMLVDVEIPIFPRIDPSTYSNLKTLMLSASHALWVTNGGSQTASPGFGMIDGFARVLRLERNKLKLTTLALENVDNATEDQIRKIVQVLNLSLQNPDDTELEYTERDGALSIGRVSENVELKLAMLERLTSSKTITQSVKDTKPFATKIATPGELNTLKIVEDGNQGVPLMPDEIEVEVQAVGLNVIDSLVVVGKHESSNLGSECAGIVRAVGVNSNLRLGDRVCMFGSNLSRSFARTTQKLVARIPDEVSFSEASVLPQDHLIASYLVHDIARLSKEDSILIHGGHSSLGKAAINLSIDVCGLINVATATKEDEKVLKSIYSNTNIRFFSDASLSDQLNRATSGRGVDVVLNLSSESEISNLLACISAFGRFVHVKSQGKAAPRDISLSCVPLNTTFTAVDIVTLLQTRLDPFKKPLQYLIDMAIKFGKPDLQQLRIFRLSEMEDAFVLLREIDSRERVVVKISDEDLVSVVKEAKVSYSFDPKSSYLIAGGLGDLGRCVAKWMISRGAKSLILLSRSGPCTDVAHMMIQEMRARNVQVNTPLCDITNKDALEKTIRECARTLPPIKGCIQTSAALNDKLYEIMTYEDWAAATNPKVNGSWNLHELLPKGMDFFILASSISGILGRITQINYAAGNTYQDALAKFRVMNGEKAVSLDLGLLMTGGLASDNDLVGRLTMTGHYTLLSEPEILSMFDYFCDPTRELLAPSRAQVIVGIRSPAEVCSQGKDILDVMRQPFWRQTHLVAGSQSGPVESREQSVSLSALLNTAESVTEEGTIVTSALTHQFARMTSMPEENINIEEPLHTNGVDSLSAVDLRNWISKTFNVDVPVFDILGDISLAATGLSIARKRHEALDEVNSTGVLNVS